MVGGISDNWHTDRALEYWDFLVFHLDSKNIKYFGCPDFPPVHACISFSLQLFFLIENSVFIYLSIYLRKKDTVDTPNALGK